MEKYNSKPLCMPSSKKYYSSPQKVSISQKVFIFNKDGKFLVLQRSPRAVSNRLRWDVPGGFIEFGEDPLEALKREVKEETGLSITTAQPFGTEAHINSKGIWRFTVAYTAQTRSRRVVLSHEHVAWEWMSVPYFLTIDTVKKLKKFAKTLKKAQV